MFTIPDEFVVEEGHSTSKQITLDLDDGKYRIKVYKQGVANWGQEFLVGLTEAEYKVLSSRKPKHVKVVFTSEGVRWQCKLCDNHAMTGHGAIKHEWIEHFGLDPTKINEEDLDDLLSTSAPTSNRGIMDSNSSVIPPLTRRPGRPRKEEAPPSV